ncbi:MAG: immune inhibitor A [Anaerolineales bacterium]|nr:immune inhibitor A [Anaerolineales bacterium]
MEDRKIFVIGGIIIGVLVLCICCLAVVGGISFFTLQAVESTGPDFMSFDPTPTPHVVRPTIPEPDNSGKDGSSGDPVEVPTGMEDIAAETLDTLENSIVPINDPNELAERLGGVSNVPDTIDPPAEFYEVGDKREFWASNVSSNENFQIDATLAYVTDHAYFWIEDGVRYDESDLEELAEEFEDKIYPTDRNFFGSEWTPGIDGDPHIYILYAENLGFSIAGYFSTSDEMHPLAHEYSNAAEMFYLSADNVGLHEEFTYGVLAHEFQHMIHWNMDRNETSWLNEGFSELAAFLNDYDPGGFDTLFISNPDHQLNDWPNDQDATGAYYGAAFLYTTYLLDRLGDEATQAIVAHPDNGLDSIDNVLQDLDVTDDLTGEPMTADDLTIDWAIANYLKDPNVGDGRYYISIYPNSPQADETETISACDSGAQTRDVHQYGADYIRITCQGEHTLSFEGSLLTTLLPEGAYSGDYSFWSNKGDSSDMTLTQEFDFTDVSGPINMDFKTWYDIEDGWDYVYLTASTDGGDTWEILRTPSGTDEDPSGNSYGWGWNALSGGGPKWIDESVDLSQFAGEEVMLRFEYITDAAVNGEGMLIDDISIPAIGYFNDFESDEGGWEADGFVRVSNTLPQTFRLAVISYGVQTNVEYIYLDADGTAEIPLSLGGDVDEVVLVVMGTTRFTRQTAAYRFEITP